ncbi:hypothetical protein PhCBS80983_g00026 [Powellomyces hirtus]|uniref:sn-1-specific diacylglycerol lipase n=1 Tax=Powellomyces hirtus TaxID=109895 RepID=A0A507EG48_9FUNG|nr:hypothetical protein PhCBS80983_g00026 [Powellomyces hirtus]
MDPPYTVVEPDDDVDTADYDIVAAVPQPRAQQDRLQQHGHVEQHRSPNARLSNVMTGLRFMFGVASAASETGFAIAKAATHVSLDVARNIVDGVGEATGLDAVGVTPLVSNTLAFAEFCALLGIETGRFWTKFGLSTGASSVRALNNVFGSTEMATAIKQFARLVRRELSAAGDDGSLSLREIGTVDSVRALMAWVCLQYATSTTWTQEARAGAKLMKFKGAGEAEEEPEEVDWTNVGATQHADPGDVVEGSIGQPHEAPSSSTEAPRPNGIPSSTQEQDTDKAQTQLLTDLRRYVKFATGMYGRHQISALNGEIPDFGFDINPDPRRSGNAEHRFFASHADTPLESIYHSTNNRDDFDGFGDILGSGQKYKPTVYVIADHSSRQVIIAFRGTNSFEDVLVDLTCEYDDFMYGDATPENPHCVHSGMMRAALAVAEDDHSARVKEAVVSLLIQNPGYGLLLTGHSLGAGLATCLTLLWTDPSTGLTPPNTGLPTNRPIRCFAYAAPSVVSPPLGILVRPFIISVLVGADLVGRLSLGSVRDLARVVAHLHSESDTRDDLLKRIAFGSNNNNNDNHEADWQLRKRIEQKCLLSEKLYTPGRVFWILEHGNDQQESAVASGQPVMYELETPTKAFNQILFSTAMARDHLPHVYSSLLHKLE